MSQISVLQFRRDTAAGWTTKNPKLYQGEPALESDTNKLKIGDGINRWVNLPYLAEIPNASITNIKIADNAITNIKIANNEITNEKIAANAAIDITKINGAISQTNGTVTTSSVSLGVVRNIYTSTSNPSGGMDGDVWMVYT
jgi:hypothetical protein